MAKLVTKNSFTSGSAPSGLSAGELAVNVVDKKIFVGNAVGGVVTLHDQQNVVTSVNGITGPVGITFGKNISLTQSGQTLTIGISAARPGDTGAIQFNDGSGGLSASTLFNYTTSSGTLRVGGATRFLTLYNTATYNVIANNGTATLCLIAPGSGVYMGDPLSGASGTYVLVDSSATDAVTIRANTTKFDRALPIITGTNPSGYLSIRTTGTDYIVPCNPIITLQDADNDLGSRSSILITPSVGSASDLYLGSTSLTDTTIRGTSVTLVPRSTHSGGITTAHLYVSGGATFIGNISAPNIVNSVNGATGAVTNVARTNVAQTFTQLQDFSAGLSATSGCSFNNATVYITNSSAVDPLFVQHLNGSALKVATTGQARSGAIKLGNAATPTQNTFISQTDGTLTLYNGFSATGSNMISISTTAITIPTTISGATFSGLLRSSSGISAELGICGGTYMSSGGGYRITSNAIRTLTGTTYTLLSTDDGKIITSSNNSTQIFTVPSGLPVGFNCSVIQLGTGVVGFSAASGVTMNSFAGKTFMAGQHAAVSIIGYSTNIFNLSGGLTT